MLVPCFASSCAADSYIHRKTNTLKKKAIIRLIGGDTAPVPPDNTLVMLSEEPCYVMVNDKVPFKSAPKIFRTCEHSSRFVLPHQPNVPNADIDNRIAIDVTLIFLRCSAMTLQQII